MFLFSVSTRTVGDSNCRILRPCLDKIKPTLDSDSIKVQEDVLVYFTDMVYSKAITISNYVQQGHAYLKTLQPYEISELSHKKGGVFLFLDDSNLWSCAGGGTFSLKLCFQLWDCTV